MKRVQVFMLSVCPIALMTTGSLGESPGLPTGALDSEETYAEFWSGVVGTEFEFGACAFTLGAISPAGSTWVIGAVDDRIGDSEPFRVGEFMMSHQEVIHTFEPITYTNAHDHLIEILINHMTQIRVDGVAAFDGGETVHLSAHLYISNTENPTTGEVMQELQRAFVPRFVGVDARDRGDDTPRRPALVASPPQNDATGGNDLEPCGRFWTRCRDTRGFCSDIAICMQNFAEDIDTVRNIRRYCREDAKDNYPICLDQCEPFGGPLCQNSCHDTLQADLDRCTAAYLKRMTAIHLERRACINSAKTNNSAIHPGCDCPEGMTPFPDQRSPTWDDVPCRP